MAERKDVLSTLFALLTMLAYVRYTAHAVRDPIRVRNRAVCAGSDVETDAGDASLRAVAVGLLAVGRWNSPPNSPRPWGWRSAGRTAFWLVIEKVPLLILAAASSVVTCIAQQSKGAMAMLSNEMSFSARLLNALVSYVAYLGKTIWPSKLIIFYPCPPQRPWWQPVLAAVFLIAVTGLAIWTWRRRPYLAVGWFWYLGTLLPVIGLVQVERSRWPTDIRTFH